MVAAWSNQKGGLFCSWHHHVAAVKANMRTQTYALIKLTASTWGAFLLSLCLLYTFINSYVFNKASIAWHFPVGTSFAQKWLLKELSHLQNSCLRVSFRVYKATPVKNLEARIEVLPL
jgi:hypothetical protein